VNTPTVVLLHAFPLDSRMWDAQRAALRERGWHVVAPDLPGPESANTLEAWAERVLANVDGALVPVGASMGGYLAWELWRRGRERIAALVLVDTRATGETDGSRAGRDEAIRVVCEEGVAELWEGLERRILAPGASAVARARAREIALEQGSSRLRAALEAIRDREDATALLPQIDVPALVLVGEEDAIAPPEEAAEMAAALPNARLVRVPRAGHLAPLEAPEAVTAALLEFLDGLPTKR